MPDGAPARSVLPAVFLSTFFIRLGFGLTLSIFAFYLGSTVETTGLTAAASPTIEAATVLFAGIAADRYGRLPVLKLALLSGAALLATMAFTRDPMFLTLLSGAFGFTSASILAASLAVTGDVSALGERGLEMGRFDAFNLAGWVYGFALGYILVSLVDGEKHPANLTLAFFVGAGAVLVALAVLVVLSRGHIEHPSERAFDREGLRNALLRPGILLVVLPWMSIYMLIGTLFTFLGSAASTLKIPPWELGVGVAAAGTLLLFTQPFYGKLSDRVGRTKMMLVGVAGFLGVLVFGSAIALFGIAGMRVLLLAGIGLSAIPALSFGPSSLAALTDASKQASRGATMGLYSLSIAGGMAIGLIASSEFYTLWRERGVVLFFALVGALLLFFTILRLRLLRRLEVSDLPPLTNSHAPSVPK